MGLFNISDLIREIKDGIEIKVEVEANAYNKILRILGGEAGELPFKFKVKIDE